jgi:hypothetical protein
MDGSNGTHKDTEDTTLVQIEEVERAIRALPFVTKLSPVGARNSHGHGYQVSLRCPSCEEYGSCGKKQEFGDAGNDTSCKKQFNLDHRKCEDYQGTRFYNKDSVLVIKRWLNRVEEDTSGLTFQEWTPDVDTSRPPVAMLIKSSELRPSGFKLKEVLQVFPPALETTGRVHATETTPG